jgi:hypothetical protein
MSLVLLRSQLVTALAGALTCPVQTVGGAFDGAELRRHVTHAPVALVSLASIADFKRHGPAWRGRLTFVVYLVTRDTPTVSRDVLALDLVSAVMSFAHDGVFSAPGAFSLLRPGDGEVSADNLYSGAVDSIAVALWAVRWRAVATCYEGPP